ncbi:MAG: hypothetical protein ABGY43_19045 [bacterium]
MTSSTGVMLVEIDSIFSLGISRSGYDERLKAEQHLVNRFNEIAMPASASNRFRPTAGVLALGLLTYY